jgi:hypothetical protein
MWQDTNTSENLTASIFWVVPPCSDVAGYQRFPLMMEAAKSYHISVECHNPDDHDLKLPYFTNSAFIYHFRMTLEHQSNSEINVVYTN